MHKSIPVLVFSFSIMFAQVCSAAGSLIYPGDCKNSTLEKAAKKNGCSLVDGGKHWKVMKDAKMITTIPYSVKDNGTCREIIKVLNSECS